MEAMETEEVDLETEVEGSEAEASLDCSSALLL